MYTPVSVKIEDLQVYNPTLIEIETSDDLVFFNPRILSIKEGSESQAVGFDEQSMSGLKTSIAENGILTPLLCRKVVKEDKSEALQVVNGHRRLKAIEELKKDSVLCYDPTTNSKVDANDLYKNLNVYVFDNLADIKAFELSFDEEVTKVKYGPEAELNFTRYCLSKGVPDKTICDILKKSQEWLRTTKEILTKLESDKVTLDAVIDGRVNRSSAIELLSIDDVDQRHEVLNEAIEDATEEANEKIEKIEKQVSKIKRSKIDTVAKQIAAVLTEDEATEKLEELDEKLEEKLEEIKNTKPKVSKKNISSALDHISEEKKDNLIKPVSKSAKPLNNPAYQMWMDKFKELYDNKGVDSAGDTIADPIFLQMCMDLLSSVDSNKGNPEIFLSAWKNQFSVKLY